MNGLQGVLGLVQIQKEEQSSRLRLNDNTIYS